MKSWLRTVLSVAAALALALPPAVTAGAEATQNSLPIGTSVTVTFQPNGGTWHDGTTLTKTATAAVGSAVSAPGTIWRSGFFLGGWYTDAALLNKWDLASAVQGPMTLYAGWSLNYPSYSRSSGSGSDSGHISPDQDIDRTTGTIADPGIPLVSDAPPAETPDVPLPRTGFSVLKLGGLGLATLVSGVLLSMRSRKKVRGDRKPDKK